VTSRLVDRAELPTRKDFTTLIAFFPALKELVDRGVLTGNKSRMKNLLSALALFEADPHAFCSWGHCKPTIELKSTRELTGMKIA